MGANPYPVLSRVAAFGGLFLIWKLFGWQWMIGVIGLACAYHVYFRVRHGYWLLGEPDDPPFRETPAYRAYHRLRYGYWPPKN